MYPEFVIIYVGLLIVFVISIVNLVFTLKIAKRMSGSNLGAKSSQTSGVAFCKKCATEFDVNLKVCPNCGTIR